MEGTWNPKLRPIRGAIGDEFEEISDHSIDRLKQEHQNKKQKMLEIQGKIKSLKKNIGGQEEYSWYLDRKLNVLQEKEKEYETNVQSIGMEIWKLDKEFKETCQSQITRIRNHEEQIQQDIYELGRKFVDAHKEYSQENLQVDIEMCGKEVDKLSDDLQGIKSDCDAITRKLAPDNKEFEKDILPDFHRADWFQKDKEIQAEKLKSQERKVETLRKTVQQRAVTFSQLEISRLKIQSSSEPRVKY